MPAGVSNPVIGYLGFCAVKLVGYSFAARLISWSYERNDRNRFLVGGVRTLIGMGAGAAYFGFWRLIPDAATAGGIGYLIGLLPVRMAEWWLLLWLFYDRRLQQRPKDWRIVVLATIWSYVLDVPALIGLLVTGGVWVC
jgi:hypothetical protein